MTYPEMEDGTYRVVTSYFVAGFVIENGSVVSCAPILRKKLGYWKTIAERISEKGGEVFKVMGTGSRKMVIDPHAKEIYDTLEKYILQLREEHSSLVLISGMAEGWDEAIAKVGARNNIPYHAYVPHPTYGEYYWGRKSLTGRDRLDTFKWLLGRAEEVFITAESLYVDGTHVNFLRNTDMVNACDMALVYNKKSGGTRDAVSKLVEAGKPFVEYPFFHQEQLFE